MKRGLKKLCFIFLVLFLGTPLLAHEFWLQPVKFTYRKGEKINIRFMVGENFEGENWTGDKSKINKLQSYAIDKVTDLFQYTSKQKGDSLQF
jgi:uncharacterized GH25 family protein